MKLHLPFALCALPLAACGASATARAPAPTVIAQPVGVIDARDLGPAYLGGAISRIAGDGRGAILATTKEPYQLLKIAVDGRLLWALDACGPEGEPCAGPGMRVSAAGEEILLVESRARRLNALGTDGSGRARMVLNAAFDAAMDPSGNVFVYPGSDGFLLDVLDHSFRYQQSIVPLPESEMPIGSASCLLLPDSEGGVFALWNPTRTIFRIGADGERVAEFSIETPEVAENVAARLRRLRSRATTEGALMNIEPFGQLTRDPNGALAALYLFDESPDAAPASTGGAATAYAAAVYRFGPDGRSIDVIRGLGAVSSVAFGREDELFGLEWMAQRIVRLALHSKREDGR